MVEGGVNEVLELLEDGGNTELIDVVWLYSEEGCRRGAARGMIGRVHKVVDALALTSKVGLLNLLVQGELI